MGEIPPPGKNTPVLPLVSNLHTLSTWQYASPVHMRWSLALVCVARVCVCVCKRPRVCSACVWCVRLLVICTHFQLCNTYPRAHVLIIRAGSSSQKPGLQSFSMAHSVASSLFRNSTQHTAACTHLDARAFAHKFWKRGWQPNALCQISVILTLQNV